MFRISWEGGLTSGKKQDKIKDSDDIVRKFVDTWVRGYLTFHFFKAPRAVYLQTETATMKYISQISSVAAQAAGRLFPVHHERTLRL